MTCTSNWSGAAASGAFMSAAGETEIQRLATGQSEHLSTAAGAIHHIYVCTYIFSLVELHPVQTDRRTEGSHCCCLCVGALRACLWSVWTDMYTLIYVVNMCALCVYLPGIYLQPHYWLNLRRGSGISLISLRLLDPARYVFLLTEFLAYYLTKYLRGLLFHYLPEGKVFQRQICSLPFLCTAVQQQHEARPAPQVWDCSKVRPFSARLYRCYRHRRCFQHYNITY